MQVHTLCLCKTDVCDSQNDSISKQRKTFLDSWNGLSEESNAILRFLSYHNDIKTAASWDLLFVNSAHLKSCSETIKNLFFLLDWKQCFTYIFQQELKNKVCYRPLYNSPSSKRLPSCCSPAGLWRQSAVSSYTLLTCCSWSLHVWLCSLVAVAIFK